MARKKSSGDSGALNLDSLMDALTNVVAVLILVLLLVNLDVTKKMVEIFEHIEPATEEDIQKSKDTLAKLEIDKHNAENLLKETPPTPEEIEEIKRLIEQIKQQIALKNEEQKSQLQIMEELKLRLAKAKANRDGEQKKTEFFIEEIRRLEILINSTPVVEAIAPTEVKIPNSRPIPSNAEIFTAMVREGRVHLVPPMEHYFEMIEKELRARKRDLSLETTKKGTKDVIIYDQLKTLEHFKNFDFKAPPGQVVAISAQPWASTFSIRATPDFKNSGTTLEQLDDNQNEFAQALRKLRSNSNAVVIFQVEPKSFLTYIKARSIVDGNRLPSGWEISANTSMTANIPDVSAKPTGTPPPAPASTPGAAPKPTPPKIAPKLD